MARLLWGKVYYKDIFAGILREEPGNAASFQYDPTYLENKHPAISYTMPTSIETHISHHGLHPFFDNLVAEGWLEHAQSRLLKNRNPSRFELLLTFGFDCAGAVSIIDPEPENLSNDLSDIKDPKEIAALTSRASLSGVQPKLAIIERHGLYHPTRIGEISTHLAKFPSHTHPDLIENEYLTMRAFDALLPHDSIVELSIGTVVGINEPALLIKRFDRTSKGRIHFEEFNQLLAKRSSEKYNGSYEEMSLFIQHTKVCVSIENVRLYERILAGLLLGNTDMHFKNFSMMYTEKGLYLTPSYDQVSATLYDYQTIALGLDGKGASGYDRSLKVLKTKNLLGLGEEFQLPKNTVLHIIKNFAKTKEDAKETIFSAPVGKKSLKADLIKGIDTRWNGIFASAGQTL
jgi:serine/threonine-protein kinase HipA